MKRAILLAAAVWAGACDYTVPLEEAPAREIDRRVIGRWERTRESGEVDRLLVLPMGPREYLVMYVFPSGMPDALFGRAWPIERDDEPGWVQLHWFGAGRGQVPDADAPIYQVAWYRYEDEELAIRLLNPEVVSPEATTAGELAQAIEENRDHADLFREEAVLTRVEADRPQGD